jgi:hypothetical protein
MTQPTEKEVSRRIEVDRKNATSKDAYVFARADWDFQVDASDVLHITPPPPGTWSPPCEGYETQGPDYDLAWLSCPKCRKIVVLDTRVHSVDARDSRLSPDFRHQGCSFARRAYLDKWGDKPLYAMAYWQNGSIEKLYTHASTAAVARLELIGVPDGDVIAIGLAVGFFVDERANRNGLILTAD